MIRANLKSGGSIDFNNVELTYNLNTSSGISPDVPIPSGNGDVVITLVSSSSAGNVSDAVKCIYHRDTGVIERDPNSTGDATFTVDAVNNKFVASGTTTWSIVTAVSMP